MEGCNYFDASQLQLSSNWIPKGYVPRIYFVDNSQINEYPTAIGSSTYKDYSCESDGPNTLINCVNMARNNWILIKFYYNQTYTNYTLTVEYPNFDSYTVYLYTSYFGNAVGCDFSTVVNVQSISSYPTNGTPYFYNLKIRCIKLLFLFNKLFRSTCLQ